MLKSYQLLLIDKNERRRHDLNVILEFLGEPIILSPTSNWTDVVNKPEGLLAVIVGDVGNIDACCKLIKDFYSWGKNIPILLLGNQKINNDCEKYVLGNIDVPYKMAQILDIIHCCQVAQENNLTAQSIKNSPPIALFRSLVGTSSAITQVRKLISQVADSDASVLITGESGTGKEVVARNLHNCSPRRDKPFVPINCGAIPSDLLESELFGHEKGAFTGAITARQGRFELAHGGTIFLDEIGDMPLPMQVKLLRVLQERCFERVGSNKSFKTDVRIIAATHCDLENNIEKGTFREDLYYRLNVFPIEMPSLRNRVEDLPELLHELTSRIEGQEGAVVHFLPNAVKALCDYPWPGNVRELANFVERMAVLYPNGVVDVSDLPNKFASNHSTDKKNEGFHKENAYMRFDGENDHPTFSTDIFAALPPTRFNLKEHLVKTELALIRQALDHNGGIVARAADYLSMRRTTLVEKMRKYGMHRDGSVVS